MCPVGEFNHKSGPRSCSYTHMMVLVLTHSWVQHMFRAFTGSSLQYCSPGSICSLDNNHQVTPQILEGPHYWVFFVVVVVGLIYIQFSWPKHQGTVCSFGQVVSCSPVQISTLQGGWRTVQRSTTTVRQCSTKDSHAFAYPRFQLLLQLSIWVRIFEWKVYMSLESKV